jgi:hypothetical protein
MSDYLRRNFTFRRIFALLVALGCFALCIAVVLGKIQMALWQVVIVLLVGLLFYEWAG